MNRAPESGQNTVFSVQDMDRLHHDDLHAAQIVVGLMTGVFLMGLMLYSCILFIVW